MFVGVLLHIGGARLDGPSGLALLFGSVIIVIAGETIVSWAIGNAPAPALPLIVIIGSLATSLFLEAGYFLTGQQTPRLFLWWSAAVVVVAVYRLRQPSPVEIDVRDLGAMATIAVCVAFWCRHSAALVPTIETSATAPVWTDYFIHGTAIAQFGDRLGSGRLAFALADLPIGLYHYASYMLPAAVSRLVDIPSVGLAASVLYPYGILTLTLGVYACVGTLATRWLGVLAALALLFLPDVSAYGLKNGFFSLHWFLGASPGTAHALGVVFAALTCAVLWKLTGRRGCLWAAVVVMIASFQVRALIFMLAAPALLAALLYDTRVVQQRARRIMLTAAVVLAVSVAAVALIPMFRDAWIRFSAARTFIQIVHGSQTPSAYDGAYAAASQRYGRAIADALGFVALIPAVLGALTVLLPVAMALGIARSGRRPLDTFPVWCLLGWLTIVLIAPPAAHGDATTYQYHAFPLVYAAAFVWTLLLLDRVSVRRRAVLPAILAVAVATSLIATRSLNPVQPRLQWGWQHFATPVDRGLLAAAAFVHARAIPGDTFALIPIDTAEILDDVPTRFAALANVPAYLTRPAIYMIRPTIRAAVEERVRRLRELESTTDANRARDLLRAMNVTFLVTVGPNRPSFDPGHAIADFKSDTTAVYRVRPQ